MNKTVGEVIATYEAEWKELTQTYNDLCHALLRGGMSKEHRKDAVRRRNETGDRKQVVGVLLGQLYTLVGHEGGVLMPTQSVNGYHSTHTLRLMGEK